MISHTADRRHADTRVVPFGAAEPYRVRGIQPQDAPLLAEFFASLSDEVRHDRFMGAVGEVSETVLRRLAAVDGETHVGFLAEPFPAHPPAMIAEARYIACARDPQNCEFAICVHDDWQGRGLGRALLKRLEDHAARAGKISLYAETLDTNAAMIGLARTMGYRAVRTLDSPGCVRLVKDLPTALDADTPADVAA